MTGPHTTAGATPILELKTVSTVFGRGTDRTVANRDVSLVIPPAPPSLISIVGESGSGKTTLARTLMGLQSPTSGQALWQGRDIATLGRRDMVSFRREVQAVFQDPYAIYNPFYRVDRVFDMAIGKFKLARGRDAKRSLIEDALRAVNLRPPDVLGRYPHQLSGGERQRIMLARAWMIQPKVIIADEAISMLDVAVRALVMNILLDFRERLGISTVFITHDLSAAWYLGGEIMVMQRGAVVETGPVADVMRAPQHPYTRLLLESIPSADPDERWDRRSTPVAALEADAAAALVP